MKIEKISDNQIRCTLNRADLQSRELKISELAYGTEKAKDLFHDMIEQASHQFGFETDDLPLMIEAIPVSADCIVLNITKVEDPEELDTRFSRFAPSGDGSDTPEDLDFFDDIFPPKSLHEHADEIIDNLIDDTAGFRPMKETLDALKNKSEDSEKDSTEAPVEPVSKLFSFANYNEASDAAAHINAAYLGDSELYKDNAKGKYYLLLTSYDKDTSDFLKVCNEITEYGKKESMTFSSIAYLKEHCDVIIRQNALDILTRY